MLRPAEPRRRKLSEIAAPLSEHSTATLDPDFAADAKEFVDSYREPLDASAWTEQVVDESVTAAAHRLATFGKRHGLSLDGLTIKGLPREQTIRCIVRSVTLRLSL
jgi:hypothetical protein